MSNLNRLALRIITLLLAVLCLTGAALAQTRRPIPVHVMGFTFDDSTGVLTPRDWRMAEWPNLETATEEELTATLQETDEMRYATGFGHLAVRGLSKSGETVYRGIVKVRLWDLWETVDTAGAPQVSRQAAHGPAVTVLVPTEATSVVFDGWLPASRSTFRLDEIAAQFQPSRRAGVEGVRTAQATGRYCTAPQAILMDNHINIVVFGDGYQRGMRDLFTLHAGAALGRLFNTSPWDRYRSYFNERAVFLESADTLAAHPACTDHPHVDPNEPTPANHSTALGSTFCSGSPQSQRLLTVNENSVSDALRECATGTPEIVLVMVNDPFHGGSGGPGYTAVASIAPFSANIAVHEISHSFAGVQDEYGGPAGFNVDCSDIPPSAKPCAANVTDNAMTPKWQRWMDIPLTCPATPLVGLYEGAFQMNTGWYRSEPDCLMRGFPSSLTAPHPYCNVCREELIREFYRRVNPVMTILREELRDTKPHGVFPDLAIGESILLGTEVLGINIDPDWKFTWTVNGQVIPGANTPYYKFTPQTATTTHIEVLREDTTCFLRVDAKHPRPPKMREKIGWYVVSDASATAITPDSQVAAIQTTPLLDVPRGTATVTLAYTLTTSEPGGPGRPGDFWSVDVKYAGTAGGASTLATAELPFHKEGIITRTDQNGPFVVPVKVNAAAGDVQVVAVVTVKNLESSEFVPTTIHASLTATPAACGSDCDYCAAHPSDPGCPLNVSIDSAAVRPLPASQPNRGDSSLFSLGERLDAGRLVDMKMTTPANFTSLRVIVTALTWDGKPLMNLRDVTWFSSPGDPRGGVQGLERDPHDSTHWELNISPKKDFPDVNSLAVITPPEDKWVPDIRYLINATVKMPNGRSELATYEITHIYSPSTPSANDTRIRPMHALWHSPASHARWHYWSSVAMNKWLSTTTLPLHVPDRIADEYAGYDTPLGHESGSGITEVPFYPGATRYDTNNGAAYSAFYSTAIAALNASPAGAQAAARATLVNWINVTRTHLEALLADSSIAEVRVGDGNVCTGGAGTAGPLPLAWMKQLLQSGRIVDGNATVVLDLTGSVAGSWTPPNAGRLTFTCLDNNDINILVDRCRIGDLPNVYCTTGRTNIHRTHILVQPQAVTIDPGQTTNLTVSAEGDDLHYQWYVGTTNSFVAAVPHATGASLTVAPDATTSYWVLVSGALGDDASAAALVTVTGSTDGPCDHAPSISSQPPVEILMLPGEGASMDVGATGQNLRYQWYQRDSDGNPIPIAGAQLAHYVAQDFGRYFVRVTNACGTADSVETTIVLGTTCFRPSITGLSASKTTVGPGESVTLSANITGRPPLSIVWYQETPDGQWTTVGNTAQVTVTPPADQTTYFVGASNECGSVYGTELLVIHICTPPAIAQQPVAPHFTAFGQSANVTVAATGSDLHYEWNVSGSSRVNDSPSLPIVAPPAPLYVFVRVSNDCGLVDSTTVTIDPPCDPPAMHVQPQGGSIVRGATITLTASAFGTEPSYQWSVKAPADTAFATISGATAESITVSPAVDQTQYKVVIHNGCGTVESNVVTVAVTEPCIAPQIDVEPAPQGIESGHSVNLTVSATGTNLTYQWYEGAGRDNPVAGATSASLTAWPSYSTSYWCRVSGTCGMADSELVEIDVCGPPSIDVQPQGGTINSGSSTTLSVTPYLDANAGPIEYHWYQGMVGDTSTPVGTDSPSFTTPALTVTTRYWVALTTGVCETDSQQATVSMCALPAVAATGTSSVRKNQSITLTLSPNPGTSGISYQWYRGASGNTSNPIAGATAASTTVTIAATGDYWCRVTGASCTVNSSALTVSVCIPNITTQPAGGSLSDGQTLTLTVASDLPSSTYQWYRGASGDTSSPVSGATAASYTAGPGPTTSYWVRVTGSCGTSVDSNAATVSCVTPSISTHPTGIAITRGQTINLTVAANGTGLTYQWYQGAGTASPFGGATSATLTATPQVSTAYWCRVTGSCGTADSQLAQVDVCSAPVLSTQPQSQTINSGQTATLSVSVQANALNPAPHYHWYRGTVGDRSTTVGGDSATFITPALTTATSYWVAVNGGTCETASAQATISICALPAVTATGPTSIQKGQVITLSLSPNPGTSGITYQWYEGTSGNTSSAVPGNAYAVTVQPQATTSYWCRVTNATCSVNSTAVTANVCIPRVTTDPIGTTNPITNGQTWTMTVATDVGASTVQWYRGTPGNTGSPVAGATAASVTVNPSVTTTYFARVTGPCGYFADSAAATVTVCVLPAISGHPTGTSITRGQTVNLTVTAAGTGLTYQWYQGAGTGSPYGGGGNSATLTATPQVPTAYWCRVTGSCGTADSQVAQVDVCATPVINAQPLSQTVADGGTANLSVTATQPTGLAKHYQWYRSIAGNPINPVGDDLPTYTTSAITAETSYFVRITSGNCSLDSATATISTCPLPVMQTIGGGNVPRYQTLHLRVIPAPEDVTFTFYEGPVGDTSNFVGGGGIQSMLSLSASHNTQYWARVDNGICQVDTAATVVTVY